MKRRLCRLAAMLAAPLLAGCAYDSGYYDGGYYDPPPRYGYGYGYGYGSYGYGYGRSCGWFDDCYGWGGHRHHRHHGRHHWDDDDDDDDHHHRPGGDDGVKGPPPVDRDRHAANFPPPLRDRIPGRSETRGSDRGGRASSPGPIWIPDTGRDSRR